MKESGPKMRCTLRSRTRGIALLAISTALAACDSPETETEEVAEPPSAGVEFPQPTMAALPPGVDPALVERGRALFDVCSVCHGFQAEGTELGPPLATAEWIQISGEITEIEQVIRTGVDRPVRYPVPMPQMGGGDFDPQELRAIASYVYALANDAS